MNQIEIEENSSISLDDESVDLLKEILENNPKLPLKLNGKVLDFEPYVVGEIKLGDRLITIKPPSSAA